MKTKVCIISTHATFLVSHRLKLLSEFLKYYDVEIYVGSNKDLRESENTKILEQCFGSNYIGEYD